MSLLSQLKIHLSKSPLDDAKDIVVAFSGGVDSHVLLHALNELKQCQEYAFQLHAIHIHHGLSPYADLWQNHCQQVCADLGVPFQTASVAVKAQPRQSLEALARDARYQKLIELAPANSQIVLAQHQDDQLETFLLQLKRGAGPKGLSAMNRQWLQKSTVSPDKEAYFYRPLLDIAQQEVIDYAEQHQLTWVEDESNKNTKFDRNFLRHDVLPILQKRWPGLSSSVSRSATLCAQQQSMIDEVCAEKLTVAAASVNSLWLAELTTLSDEWLKQLVRFWLSEQGILSPSFAILNQLKADVIETVEDATPILQWQGWQFRRFDQKLFVIPTPSVLPEFEVSWQGEASLYLPADLGHLVFTQEISNETEPSSFLAFNPDLGPLTIRLGGYSAKLKPKGSPHSKPIKQWFKLWKIPPWERVASLVFLQNDTVIGLWVDGYWYLADAGDFTKIVRVNVL